MQLSWNVRTLAMERGWTETVLRKTLKLNYGTVSALWNNERDRIDLDNLSLVCRTLHAGVVPALAGVDSDAPPLLVWQGNELRWNTRLDATGTPILASMAHRGTEETSFYFVSGIQRSSLRKFRFGTAVRVGLINLEKLATHLQVPVAAPHADDADGKYVLFWDEKRVSLRVKRDLDAIDETPIPGQPSRICKRCQIEKRLEAFPRTEKQGTEKHLVKSGSRVGKFRYGRFVICKKCRREEAKADRARKGKDAVQRWRVGKRAEIKAERAAAIAAKAAPQANQSETTADAVPDTSGTTPP